MALNIKLDDLKYAEMKAVFFQRLLVMQVSEIPSAQFKNLITT